MLKKEFVCGACTADLPGVAKGVPSGQGMVTQKQVRLFPHSAGALIDDMMMND